MSDLEEDNIPGSLHQAETAYAVVCGFWKRVFALVLDGLLLGVIGLVLGITMFDQLAQLGGWGRLVGFCIALIYFGVFNSVIGKGQTLGKKLVKIHVIDPNGNHISLAKSFLRYAILGLPYFLNGALLPNSLMMSPILYLLSLLIFGFGAAILYLYLFNRRTRQSLHDLAIGTFVSTADSHGAAIGTVWKPHLIVSGILLAVSVGLPAITQGLTEKWEFSELLETQKQILSSGKVHHATAQAGKTWGQSNGKKWERTYFQSVAFMKERPTDPAYAAREIAQIVLKANPNAMEKDIIAIITTYGYDIGIARSWRSYNASYPPEEWQRLIDKYQAE